MKIELKCTANNKYAILACKDNRKKVAIGQLLETNQKRDIGNTFHLIR